MDNQDPKAKKPFIELDPKVAAELVSGYQNELEPAQKALDAFYRQFRCKRCGSECGREVLAHHAFSEDSLVPRCILRCRFCRFLFDPHTGIVLERGNEAIIPGVKILDPQKP